MAEQFTISLIEKTLNLERFANPDKIDWFDKSFDTNSDFWPSLFKLHNGFFGSAGKSIPFKQYAFFHDIIFRNQNRENPAFIWYEPTGCWKEISYRELGEKSEKLALSWIRSGVMPGQTVCIIKKMGPGYLTSLLAGLHIGVVLSFIMPEAKTLMKEQLESLDPDYICTEDIYLSLLLPWQEKIIEEDNCLPKKQFPGKQIPGKQSKTLSPYTYMTGDSVALLFDPKCCDIVTPRPVSSDLLFFSGIRDGIIGLGLVPGEAFFAPGFNEILTQPSFILSVLLNGATYLHCSIKDIAKQPELLRAHPLKILGINPELRNLLMEHPVLISDVVKLWFRDPSEDSDLFAWNVFIDKLQLEDIPAGCMVWNTSMGGCLLFSRRHKGQAFQNVLPMPGRKWQMGMFEDGTVEALGCTGLFSVSTSSGYSSENEEDAYIPTSCILSKTYLEYMFAGLIIPSKKGLFYPFHFINAIVEEIDLCEDSLIVEVLNADGKTGSGFHLLIFTGHRNDSYYEGMIPRVRKKICSEMGKKFDLDDIKLIPLCPRRGQDNKIDEDWCSMQYLNGMFKKKTEDELFLNLSRLRAHVLNYI